MVKPLANAFTALRGPHRWPWIIPALIALLIIGLSHLYQWSPWPWRATPALSQQPLVPNTNQIKENNKSNYTNIPEPPVAAPADALVAKNNTAFTPQPPHSSDQKQITLEIEKESLQPDMVQKLISERKKEFGIKKSIDLVAKPGELICVGKKRVALDQILATIDTLRKNQPASKESFLFTPSILIDSPHPINDEEMLSESAVGSPKAGQLLKKSSTPTAPENTQAASDLPTAAVWSETSLQPPMPPKTTGTAKGWPAARPPAPATGKKPINYFGIYLVQPGDNLWDTQFAFIREYFGSRGINVATNSDRPLKDNLSSGIGRILKYMENKVFIFNLKTKQLSTNLSLLAPHEKIVIFNLSHLHQLLQPLSPSQINKIRLLSQNDLILE